jgi:hypothetical protein
MLHSAGTAFILLLLRQIGTCRTQLLENSYVGSALFHTLSLRVIGYQINLEN